MGKLVHCSNQEDGDYEIEKGHKHRPWNAFCKRLDDANARWCLRLDDKVIGSDNKRQGNEHHAKEAENDAHVPSTPDELGDFCSNPIHQREAKLSSKHGHEHQWPGNLLNC